MNRKRTTLVIIKIALTAALFAWLFHKVSPDRVWDSVRHARPAPFVGGVLLCWLTVLIAGWRWDRLLNVIGLAVPLPSLIGIAQIGQFFSMFLPGPTGDDLTRMLYVSKIAQGRVGEACATVLLDRIIGLASVLLMALACLPFHWQLLAASRQTWWLALAILTAAALMLAAGLVFFLVPRPHLDRWIERGLPGLPGTKWHDRILRMWVMLTSHKKPIATVLLAAVGTQLTVCTFFYLAGCAVGIAAPFATWLGFVPVVLAASAIPISIAGLGVREYLVVLFLGVMAGVDTEHALAASLIAFAMMFTVSLMGGIVYVFFRPRSRSSPGAGAA
jgi:glycosyltransferase 2 family protein